MSTYVPPRPDGFGSPVETTAPVATWRAWQVLLITLLGFLGGSLLSTPVFFALGGDTEGRMDGAGAVAQVIAYLVLGAVLITWLRSRHPGWSRVLGWPPAGRRGREAAVGVGFGIAWQLVGVAIVALLVATIVEAFSGTSVEVPAQVDAELLGWEVAALVVYAVALAPLVEELVFRGLLYHAIADRHGPWAGAFGSAIPFGFIHVISGPAAGVIVLVVTMIVTGLVWAGVHRWRRNLLVNIAMHAGFNVVGVLLTLEMIGG